MQEGDGSLGALMAQPCLVPFQHCVQRAGNISWAQEFVWEWISEGLSHGRNPNYDLCFSVALPASTAVGDFLLAVSRMTSRHESLRTRFERAGGRLVRQEAAGSGYVDVTRYHVRGGELVTDELLRSRVSGEMIDIESSYPLRVGFVAVAGLVTHAAFAVSLVIADAAASDNVISALLTELAAIRDGSGARPEPVFQQLDQVEWELSADGLRAERQALGYWREQVAAIGGLPRPAVLDHGTMRSAVLPAESVLAAADDAARMFAVSSSAVILTALLQATAQTLQLGGLSCFLHCSNRSDQRRRDSITRLRNMALYAYSPDRPDFRSAVRAVFRDSLLAYRYAHSPGGLFLARLGAAPGDAPFVEFNDVRSVVVDKSAGPRRPPDSSRGTAPRTPVPTEIQPLDSHLPLAMLMFSVGPFVGGREETAGKPVVRLDTNVLRMDEISLLLARISRILAAAVQVASAGQPGAAP